MGLIWLLKSMILIILYHKICMLPHDASVDTSKEDGSPCQEGWIHYDTYCYKMEKDELNWGAADSKCKMMGGLLATVHSKEQNDFFEVLSNKTDVGYWWFGLHDRDSDGIFSWVDETDVDYTNWRSNEPYGDYYSGNCVAISFRHRQENYGKWFVLDCNDEIPYLCQMQTAAAAVSIGTEIDEYTTAAASTATENDVYNTTFDDVSRNGEQSCEDGWIYKDKYCYKMEKEELNWVAADSKCRMMGGFLATVHSKEQNDFFEVLSIRTDVGYWWFGLHDQDLDGIFSWVDETDVDYTNWRPDEPYGDYDSGNCVAVSYRHRFENYGKWFVLPCERKVSYLCQKKTTAALSTVTEQNVSTTAAISTVTENEISTYMIHDTTVDDMSKKEIPLCEDGWIYKELSVTDQYCFKLEKSEWNWTDASKECKKMNGNLVSIHSEKQNDNLKSIAIETGVDYWWIGLHDQDLDFTFSWDDNSDLNYRKWRPGEPDGGFPFGDCVAISFPYGSWFVLPCSRTLPYLCQKQPVSTIKTTATETETTAAIIIMTEAKSETTVSTNTATESENDTMVSTNTTTESETENTVATIIKTESEAQTTVSTSTTTETETETETTVSTSTTTDTEITYGIQNTTVDEVPKKEGPSCEDGWIYKDQYCIKMEKRSWSYASNECKKMDGNLVSIHSEEQNDNLKNIATETGVYYLWIGLHDQDLDNNFSWDDNSDSNYTKWGPGEPDGGSGSGDCVAISFLHIDIYYGKWFVFPCQETFPYLCQKKPTSITKNAELEQRAGISVTTILITIVVIIIFMALVGGIFYYKRFYIQDQRPKEGKVFFRNNERVAKPSMEFIIEPNKTR